MTSDINANSSIDDPNQLSSMSDVSEAINRYVLIVYFIFGGIGNLLNVFLFTRPTLIQTSSSLYLLFTSMSNLLVVVFVISVRLLADGFDLEIASFSLFACRFVSYIYYVCLALPPCFTAFACMDRWAASCIQVCRRRFANVRVAKRIISLTIISCFILYSHIPFTYDVDINPPPPYCSASVSSAIFVLIYQLIIYSLIPPSITIMFSIGIIMNVRMKRIRIEHAVQLSNTLADVRRIRKNPQHRLSQMQVMLVCQACIEFLATIPYSIINLVSLFVENDAYFLSLYSIVRLFIFFNYISSFYIYTLSSKLYRRELKKLAKSVFCHTNNIR
ncbi:unnamed protein product [Adineta ricciae]|uniref:G-protein coupled receptors family 1 profile domain-containing protein n=1 Tax=Adineta ricciae TaxID=249248 RepID=A0A813SC58_ADIRI|nr:unnamed protein product [Adineta ricciae]CAF0808556.1 unnamed protein product [Adineta ricciae]